MSTVGDILIGIKNGLPNTVNLARVNRAVRATSKRLFFHKSNLVSGAMSMPFESGDESASLPDDCWSLMSWPYISGNQYRLKPVPNIETKLEYPSPGIPVYFEVVGRSLYLYPPASSAITVKGYYWSRPVTLLSMTDTMPFAELFDDAIRDALAASIPSAIGKNQNEGQIMGALINSYVDEVVPNLGMKAPTRVDDNFALDNLAEGGW